MPNETDLGQLLLKDDPPDRLKRAVPSDVDTAKASKLLDFQYAQIRGNGISSAVRDLYTRLPNLTHAGVSIKMKKEMRRDPALFLGMSILKSPIKTVEWYVDGGDKESKVAAAFAEEVLKPHYRKLCRLSLRSLDFGWQPFEVVWGVRDVRVNNEHKGVSRTFRDAIVPIKFFELDPAECIPLVDQTTREFVGIELAASSYGATEKRLIPCWKLFVASHDPEYGDPRGWSLFDNAFKPYWAGEMNQYCAMRYFERRGEPMLLGRAPSRPVKDRDTGLVVNAAEMMLSKLNELRDGNACVLPSDFDELAKQFDYTLELLADDQRGEMFSQFGEFLDRLKLMGLGIPPKVLMQGTGVGTHAETKEMTGVFLDSLEAMLEDLWVEPVNSQIIAPLTMLNFGGEVRTPEFRTDGFKRTDLALMREVIAGFMEAKRAIKGSDGKTVGYGNGYQMGDLPRLFKSFRFPMSDPDEFVEVEQPEETAAKAKQEMDEEKLSIQKQKANASGPSGEKVKNVLTE